jgi:sarcosine oxidase subunit beta
MTNTNTDFDVVVIGLGIIGASCAYHLAKRGLRVAAVEALAGPAEGSTGRSFASVRAQWADHHNTDLAWRCIREYRDFEATHGFDIGYRPTGYLLLIPESQWEAQLEAVELQRSYGVPVEVLDVAKAQEITAFEPTGVAGATWGTADGQVDPQGIAVAYLTMAKSLGASTFYNFQVEGIDQAGDRWTVSHGRRALTAGYIVNAAGGWAGRTAALAGLEVPVVHSRRNVYSSAPGAPPHAVPMTVDIATGVYLRTEGDRLLFAGTRPGEPDGYRVDVDWEWMEQLLETGSERFPWLAELPLDRKGCWAGTYENTPDNNAIVGRMPSTPTWVNCCGFSGHGVIQAPVAGEIVAEEIVDGAITSYDVAHLDISRFAHSNKDSTIGLVF